MLSQMRSRPGFTLTEVLVTVALSAIVASLTLRGVNQQAMNASLSSETALAWSALSQAYSYIYADAQAAAWGGTPYSVQDSVICPKPVRVYRGLVVDDAEGTMSVPGESMDGTFMGLNVNVAPDQCIFQSAVELVNYDVAGISGAVVDFFGDADIEALSEAEFERLFDNHSLAITSPLGFTQMVDVASTSHDPDTDTYTVTTTPAPIQAAHASACGYQGAGDTETVTVITNFRYRIMQDSSDPDGEDTVLVREELEVDLGSPTVIDGTRLAIGRNIVDLQCWADGHPTALDSFRTDGREAGTFYGDDEGTLTSAQIGPTSTDIHRARVLHFQVSARTNRELPTLAFTARPTVTDGLGHLSRWDIDGDTERATLVQTLMGQVELANFLLRF